MIMYRILLIEDDPSLGPRLQRNLELEGFETELAIDGRAGLRAVLGGDYHLILLDWMLPQIDGVSLLSMLRDKEIWTPVIMLTALGRDADRVEGFRAGCDDYVTKPFYLPELFARIRAVLRRSAPPLARAVIRTGDLQLDPEAYRLSRNDEGIPLTPKEFELLYLLASHPGRTFARSALIAEIWGEESDVTDRTVDTHIASLRRKLNNADIAAPSWITTVYKVGYRWDGEFES